MNRDRCSAELKRRNLSGADSRFEKIVASLAPKDAPSLRNGTRVVPVSVHRALARRDTKGRRSYVRIYDSCTAMAVPSRGARGRSLWVW